MNFRLTKKRQAILELLQKHHGMLSAADIHAALPDVDLVTIYRNLDLFVSEGLIKKVNLDTDEMHYEHQTEPHHHAICGNCKRVIHFSVEDKKILDLLKSKNFESDSLELTVRGNCKQC